MLIKDVQDKGEGKAEVDDNDHNGDSYDEYLHLRIEYWAKGYVHRISIQLFYFILICRCLQV